MIARFGTTIACVAMLVVCNSPLTAQAVAPTGPGNQQPAARPTKQASPQMPEVYTLANLIDLVHETDSVPPKLLPAPFVLTSQQQADLDKVLDAWQHHATQAAKFSFSFKRWAYDPTFLPPKLNSKLELVEQPFKHSEGQIKYSAPDKGQFEETHTWETTDPGTPGQKSVEHNYGEHWEFDGTTIAWFDHEKHKVDRMEVLPEMRGNLIVCFAFLPFRFGAAATVLQTRYFVRNITPPNDTNEIWLEIRPRFETDAKTFIETDVILRAEDSHPTAIQIIHAEITVPAQAERWPKIVIGRQREVFQFDEDRFSLR